jgi:hypothetical protein
MRILEVQDGLLWVGVPSTAAGIALTPSGLVIHRADTESETIAWSDIDELRLEAKVSRWPHPRAASWVLSLSAAAALVWDPGSMPRVGVHVTRGHDTVLADASAHGNTGYLRGDVEAADALLQRLVRDAESRGRLAEPAALLDAVQQAATTSRPAQEPA